MEALSLLKSEHSTILGELYQMDKQLTFLESSGPIRGARILRQLVETSLQMREDLLRHTSKEDKCLYPILETRLGTDRELISVMRHEHEELLGSLESLRTELDRMTKSHDTRKTWNLVSLLQELKGELSDHLTKEERVVFWLAELRLSLQDQRKVASSIQGLSDDGRRLQV